MPSSNVLDDVVKDVLRASLMLVILNGMTLLTSFGLPITQDQAAAIKAFADSVTVIGFLGFRLLKIAHDSKPTQVQVVDSEGEDVAIKPVATRKLK